MLDRPDILIRRRNRVILGLADATLQRRLRTRDLVRVTTGAYADAGEWSRLSPIEQHRTRVLATAERLSTDVVFSHFAAAALWGIRVLGRWPDVVDVTLERASGGRSDGGLRRHCTGLDSTEFVELDGLVVTTPAQTVIDLARMLPFADGVVAMDSALHTRRTPARLTTPPQLDRRLEAIDGRRGSAKARKAVEFSTPLSDSPEESHSRVQIHLLGFPKPRLQQEFTLRNGRRAFVDFYWEDHNHIGECDGRAKYTNPEFLAGRSPQQALLEEKARENELRQQVRGFSRWEPADLYPPRRLYERLLRDGLPSSGRRI